MTKPIPRGRNGGRKPLDLNRKLTQANIQVPLEELEAFKALAPTAAERNQLVCQWMRAYTIAGGESDRLFAQSPTIGKVLGYLEATDAPDELIDEVFTLIVRHTYDEIQINKGIAKVGDSFIV
jgi:hypothetical protein